MTSPCPAPELLDDFAAGTLGEHTAARIAEHVDGCPICQARLRALDPLDADLVYLDAPAIPDHLVQDVLIGRLDRRRLALRWSLGTAGALLLALATTWLLSDPDLVAFLMLLPVVLDDVTARPAVLRAGLGAVLVLATVALALALGRLPDPPRRSSP